MKRSPAVAVYDIALWDLAGKMLGQPIHALIGTYRTEVPGYASTVDGAVTGPLSTPESFADFGEECLEMGYQGFKIHPMAWPDVQTHVETVLAIGRRVGGKMDMMIDPYCLYETFADAVKVGRACDEAGFYWYEDPYSDGGITPFSHARLREMIRTPLLMGEQVPTVEQRMDLALQRATDFVRVDVNRHGLTGSLKLAHAAETVGLDVEPHRSGPEHLQFLGAVKNANYYDWERSRTPTITRSSGCTPRSSTRIHRSTRPRSQAWTASTKGAWWRYRAGRGWASSLTGTISPGTARASR
jgi:L-alanine-DL-glutamate epimerase-like enolase superfamily enzyme